MAAESAREASKHTIKWQSRRRIDTADGNEVAFVVINLTVAVEIKGGDPA